MACDSNEVAKDEFICGVVEGFYGKPWTLDQRANLFERLSNLHLNTYMYAPKDDIKHRKVWRELYTEDEQSNLKTLIKSCLDKNVDFVYSLSPGVDMVFSSPADIQAIKDKFKQVSELGCHSFAILFDDIEPELSLLDRVEFESFAEAQVHVANVVYDSLTDVRTMLFCPTEYCGNRAIPDVETSSYLEVLGSKLSEHVKIMWTGPKVVSRFITPSSIKALTSVLKRKPIIWDNIHANDYDRRRLYLGPFKGRPTHLYNSLGGILTNPNCEYECNFIAIHTLSTWLKNSKRAEEEKIQESSKSVAKSDKESSKGEKNSTDNKEVKEQNGVDASKKSSSVVPANIFSNADLETYNPEIALKEAIKDWLLEFQFKKDLVLNNSHIMQRNPTSKLTMGDTLNSLVSSNSIVTALPDNKEASKSLESSDVDIQTEDSASKEDCSSTEGSPCKKARKVPLSEEDLNLLADLFHLPYEHGKRGQQLLADFKWLQGNSFDLGTQNFKKIDAWVVRAKMFHDKCQEVKDMFERLMDVANRPILQDLFPYIDDVRGVVCVLDAYIRRMALKEPKVKERMEDPEPWFFRGGIAEEMERLLPRSSMFTTSGSLAANLCVIRPYHSDDKAVVYKLCNNLYGFPSNKKSASNVTGDRLIGVFLEFCASNVFVVEINDNLCGYIAGSPDAKQLHKHYKERWLPRVRDKYTCPKTDPSKWTLEEQAINSIFNPTVFYPRELQKKYKAVLTFGLLPEVMTINVGQRLLQCALKSMPGLESKGIYCEMSASKQPLVDLIINLGFSKVFMENPSPPDIIILGKSL